MRLLYSIIISAYRLGISVAGIFNRKAKLWVEGRENIFDRLEAEIQKDVPLVWFHCASLGEFEQGRPVIEKFRQAYPGYKILLTFFSPSGYEIRKNYTGADHVFYLPIDTRKNAERFISIAKPKIVFFVKYEFWFNYLDVLHKRNVPLYLISAIFRADQYFFKNYGSWPRKALHYYTHVFVQDENSKNLLNAIGVTQVSVGGDTRFDRVVEISKQQKEISLALAFSTTGNPVIVAGSTWPEDDALLSELVKDHKELKLIIAPHEINEDKISALQYTFEKHAAVARYSKTTNEAAAGARVLIIDNIGMLSSLYKYGKIAYVGGGFGKGIHNILEAAAYGMPVFFGPNYYKFSEARELVRLGAGISIGNYHELNKAIASLLKDKEALSALSSTAKSYVHENTGATEKIMRQVKQVL
jgi:3-deoxy-D-manno-octulosonic-acid transferase